MIKDEPDAAQEDDPAAAFTAKSLAPLQERLLGRLNPQIEQSFEDVMASGPIRHPRFGINSAERNQQRKHERTYFRGRR